MINDSFVCNEDRCFGFSIILNYVSGPAHWFLPARFARFLRPDVIEVQPIIKTSEVEDRCVIGPIRTSAGKTPQCSNLIGGSR